MLDTSRQQLPALWQSVLDRSRAQVPTIRGENLAGVTMDADGLKAAGSSVGTAGLIAAIELEPLAGRIEFAWLRKTVAKVDDIARLIRRNIQKSIALDSLIVD